MEKPEAIHESLRALTQFFVNDGTLGDTLLRVSQMACAFTPAKYAGITMLVEGSPRTGVLRIPRRRRSTRPNTETGRGPACTPSGPSDVPHRFNHRGSTLARIRSRAAAHGILSTLSAPLSARGRSLGALNLYAETENAFTAAHEATVRDFADQACIVLTNAQVYWDARQLSENLTQAIETRETISQAVGILIAAGGRTPQDAFQVLVNASNARIARCETSPKRSWPGP